MTLVGECYFCAMSNHLAVDCMNKNRRRPRINEDGGGGGRECFKCGESGHMSRECPNPESVSYGQNWSDNGLSQFVNMNNGRKSRFFRNF